MRLRGSTAMVSTEVRVSSTLALSDQMVVLPLRQLFTYGNAQWWRLALGVESTVATQFANLPACVLTG